MSLGITPTTVFKPSIFYDANNNPLNIPCEGPKVVPYVFSVDTATPIDVFVVDFNNLFSSGQLSFVQSMSIDLTSYEGTAGQPIHITAGGINQTISIATGASTSSNPGILFATFALCTLNPAKIEFDFSEMPFSAQVPVFFYNYMHPQAAFHPSFAS